MKQFAIQYVDVDDTWDDNDAEKWPWETHEFGTAEEMLHSFVYDVDENAIDTVNRRWRVVEV